MLGKCVALVTAGVLSVASSVIPRGGELPPNYETLTGTEKQKLLWEQFILPTQHEKLPLELVPTPTRFFGSLLGISNLRTTFTHTSDIFPAGRRRFIHPFGSVATVRFEGSHNSRYTGLFEEKAVPGLVRISLAGPEPILGYTPGMALKLFVDGKPSANIIAMHSVNGQGRDRNPFSHTFSNVIPPPEGLFLNLLATRFRTTVADPVTLSLGQVSRVTARGHDVKAPETPFQIFLDPAESNSLIPSNSKRPLQEDLGTIPAGTVLWTYRLRFSPTGPAEEIGRVVTTSPFVASQFADEHLFFQHESGSLRVVGF